MWAKQMKTWATFRCGRTAQPIWMAICWTILIPVCRACQLFLLRQTAFRKGSSAGMPKAWATTEKALAVVFLTYLHRHARLMRHGPTGLTAPGTARGTRQEVQRAQDTDRWRHNR